MPDPSFHTAFLQQLLPRLRAGDPAARDQLVRAARTRLEALARRGLGRHPAVARWADADDVFNAAAMRLLRALESTPVADTRGFLNLSAAVIRRELIDLARHFHGPHGVGANHDSVGGGDRPLPDPPAARDDPAELDRWAALHEAVGRLPADLREAFGLRFYHRWTEAQIADLFGVDERTVRRRWRAACAAVRDALGGEMPDAGGDE